MWGSSPTEAFTTVKEELTQPTVLALYNTMASPNVSADASSYGLGAVLMQRKKDSSWRPIEYASRSMSTTEMHYAQIE